MNMRKQKYQISMPLIFIMMSLALAGCGASSGKASLTDAAPAEEAAAFGGDFYMTDDYKMEEMEEEGAAATGASNEPAGMAETERKLIRNVELHVETENFDVLMQTITEITQTLKGYVESSYVYNGSQYYENNRDANLTLRIPAEKLDTFLSIMSESSNVTSQNETVEDVTLQYVDLESHKEALATEHNRLLELLEQAQTVEDIITIEGRLSEVRYQMESMESRLRTLSNQVSYSTVYLYITEVKRYTPVKEQTVWEEIATGFVNSLYRVGEGIKDFFVGFVINIPYLAVLAFIMIVIVMFVKGIKRIKKAVRKKKAEKKEKASQDKEKEEK